MPGCKARFLVVRQRPGVRPDSFARRRAGQWRFANAGLPDRSMGRLAGSVMLQARGPWCSPPGGGWCASAVAKTCSDCPAWGRQPATMRWLSCLPETVQSAKAPVGRFGWNDMRLFITASTSNGGRGRRPALSLRAHQDQARPLPSPAIGACAVGVAAGRTMRAQRQRGGKGSWSNCSVRWVLAPQSQSGN